MLLPVGEISGGAEQWLRQSRTARLLALFDGVCNLVNGVDAVLALVDSPAALGPFALRVRRPPGGFTAWVEPGSEVVVNANGRFLRIGGLEIDTGPARPWDARPDWSRLHGRFSPPLLAPLAAAGPVPPILAGGAGRLAGALAAGDEAAAVAAAHWLAGRGGGLTPAGDDFLVGALLALWASWPAARAEPLAVRLATVAGPRTTRLSAAWLRAAAAGEAAQPWHDLAAALATGEAAAVNQAAGPILATGHTSGADALAGFVTAVNALAPWAAG